ncbi:PREDICTED: techylectin-5B-like [Branchiostoma belcheri]|uniref:Techylectin-5B-like n=1 Tax=Branchiostoma belcheri TaxID=7741 RepID=A0A6P4ZKN5_BRABE|nr:PREDICTED: techylectin-5B-like [Branchiostoma belcheri]
MYEQAEAVRPSFSGPGSGHTSGPPQPRHVHQDGSRGHVRQGNGAPDKQPEDDDASSHTYEEAEAVRRHAAYTSADRAYPGGASGRRGVCSFLRAHRSCLAAGIAVLLSLVSVGLAPLTFINKQEISQLSTTFDAVKCDQYNMSTAVDALKRDQDGMSTTVDALKHDQDGMSSTVDALKRDQDGMSTTVDALKRDQDGMSTTVDALKRDQDGMSTTVDALKRDQDGMSTTVDALKRDQDGMSTTVDALKRDLDNERSRITALEKRFHEIANNTDSDKPQDCKDILDNDETTPSGVYMVYPRDNLGGFNVFCDMDTDGGGWTLFQRRQDGSVDFYRGWADYKTGFPSNLNGEFWLGNDNLYRLASQKFYQLRVDMEDAEGNTAYAAYNMFAISPESQNYKLHIATYSGTAGDSLKYHEGKPFSTKDRDNDESPSSCAQKFKGAWWYGDCHESNLNGLYHLGTQESFGDGVIWYHWKGYNYSLKRTEMKLRPAP